MCSPLVALMYTYYCPVGALGIGQALYIIHILPGLILHPPHRCERSHHSVMWIDQSSSHCLTAVEMVRRVLLGTEDIRMACTEKSNLLVCVSLSWSTAAQGGDRDGMHARSVNRKGWHSSCICTQDKFNKVNTPAPRHPCCPQQKWTKKANFRFHRVTRPANDNGFSSQIKMPS